MDFQKFVLVEVQIVDLHEILIAELSLQVANISSPVEGTLSAQVHSCWGFFTIYEVLLTLTLNQFDDRALETTRLFFT